MLHLLLNPDVKHERQKDTKVFSKRLPDPGYWVSRVEVRVLSSGKYRTVV